MATAVLPPPLPHRCSTVALPLPTICPPLLRHCSPPLLHCCSTVCSPLLQRCFPPLPHHCTHPCPTVAPPWIDPNLTLNALQQGGVRGSLLEDSALSASRPASQPSRQQVRFKLVYFLFQLAASQPARQPSSQPSQPARSRRDVLNGRFGFRWFAHKGSRFELFQAIPRPFNQSNHFKQF